MAKILLTYPKPEKIKSARFGFSLRLLYLSSILKEDNHNIEYKDYSVDKFDLEELKLLLENIDMVIVEFDSFPLKRSTNLSNAEKLISYIKKINSSIKIIAFGKDCVLFPREIEAVDFTFTVDPEPLIKDVVNSLLEKDSNIEIKNTSLDELDKLPFPDRNLLSDFSEHGGGIRSKANLAKSTLIESSRGCLNSCNFCQRQGWNSNFKTHSVGYVLEEFKLLKDNNYINIWLKDDNFTFDLIRAKEILRGLVDRNLTAGMKLALSSWTKIDYELLDLAKEANVSLISFGIESSNKEILDFYQKNIDLEYVKNIIRYADEIGIYTVGNFIIGAPMETEETINNTFDYALQNPFDQVNIKILDYMAGSKLYKGLKEEIIKRRRHIFACEENKLNDFPIAELRKKKKSFDRKFKKSRKNHLDRKIKKFGLPYNLLI